jgi:hypothetical protein
MSWLFGKRLPDLDLSEPLFYLRIANRIGALVKARPATSTMNPNDVTQAGKIGYESGYMAATVDILSAIREEQMRGSP